jgi:hypothetical protein
MPAVGDDVRVIGTVAGRGTSISAASITMLHLARAATYGLEGDVSNVAPGANANACAMSVLGQTVNVDATARLADLSSAAIANSGASAFSIATFHSYIGTSTSKHLVVRTQADSTGALTALSVIIVPASTTAGISGVVDATPAPVNSTATGTPTTFSIHGVPVSADPAAFWQPRHAIGMTGASVAVGDLVTAIGAYTNGSVVVSAPTGSQGPTANDVVVDVGVPTGRDHDCF